MPDRDPIRHVIMLIMENRSFDHMMGGLSAVLPGLDGVDPAGFAYDGGGAYCGGGAMGDEPPIGSPEGPKG